MKSFSYRIMLLSTIIIVNFNKNGSNNYNLFVQSLGEHVLRNWRFKAEFLDFAQIVNIFLNYCLFKFA